MSARLSIASLTVLISIVLVTIPVGLVLYLGLSSTAKNTRTLMSTQAENLIQSIERGIDLRLQPVEQQARFIAGRISQETFTPNTIDHLNDFLHGTLAATPQVAGLAIVTPDGTSTRWGRTTPEPTTEDWSQRDGISVWLKDSAQRKNSSWEPPMFTDTMNQVVLVHDHPLYDNTGKFVGVLGQIVPLTDLSAHVSKLAPGAGLTPFVLYDNDKVLAHPRLRTLSDQANLNTQPLRTISELGDPVLDRLRDPDEDNPIFLDQVKNLEAAGSFIEAEKRFFIYLYRESNRYGPVPWTIGVYINTAVYGGTESSLALRTLLWGLGIFLLSTLAALFVARRISRPIAAIAKAAQLVEQSRFDEVSPLLTSRIAEYDDASRSFNQMVIDLKERSLIRETLGRFVPEEVARSLLTDGGHLEPVTACATILYADIENFTQVTERLGPARTIDMLNEYFNEVVEIVDRHEGVVTQFQGDAVLATFNVPVQNKNHSRRGILAALEIVRATDDRTFSGERIRIRIGINTGNIVAGAVGARDRLSYTVHGDAVNLASRIEQANKKFGTQILVSASSVSQTDDTTDSQITFEKIGVLNVRGQSTPVEVFKPLIV